LLIPPSALPHLFFFHCSGPHRDLHSFPTRRSSDLASTARVTSRLRLALVPPTAERGEVASFSARARTRASSCEASHRSLNNPHRSEEHTSELQSLAYLVCRLLLEKKKKKNHIH